MTTTGRVLAAVTLMIGLAACGDDDDGGASASFTTPRDDSSVAGGVRFALAADGVTIEEAGEVHEGAGHFHVIADAGCVDEGEGITRDADHVHLGAGQPDGVIYLAPGGHELCVQVGDGAHAATGVTDTITVNVGIADLDEWCAVVGEIDERFETVDNNEADEEWDAQRAGYVGIGRLLAQATDGIGVVDADVRADVEDALAWVTEMTTALGGATTLEEAEAALEPFWAQGEPAFGGAEEWIDDTCGVDING